MSLSVTGGAGGLLTSTEKGFGDLLLKKLQNARRSKTRSRITYSHMFPVLSLFPATQQQLWAELNSPSSLQLTQLAGSDSAS